MVPASANRGTVRVISITPSSIMPSSIGAGALARRLRVLAVAVPTLAQLAAAGCADRQVPRSPAAEPPTGGVVATEEGLLAALGEALDDEYRARATYRAVIDRFGEVRPFANIVEAEQRHIDALLGVYRRRNVEVPTDRWAGRIDVPESLGAACELSVQAEIDNAAMYTRLIRRVDDPEVQRIMSHLQRASRDRHLPAFRRCVERGGPGGRGARRGRRKNWE